MAEATTATNAMQIGFRVLRKVKVDDNVDGLNVDAARKEIGRHEVARRARAKVVENTIAVLLAHFGVNVEARVAELRDFARQQLDAVHRVAENHRLVDLQLGEERVETVHFLALFDKRIVLRDALERQLLHQVDFVGLLKMFVLESLHSHYFFYIEIAIDVRLIATLENTD